ncbi:MAG: AbgT family transporter [bacterium]|nr:AbgT family transporter [bacterium]
MKKEKKIKIHPILVFLILTFIVMILSSIGHVLKLETSYNTVNAITGELESQIVTIDSLFNRTGIQYLISNALSNFINFAPLGTIIVGLFGIGVSYKSGFLTALFKSLTKNKSRKLITFIVVLMGILFSMFYEAGYVILIPLSAILFMTLNRHPNAGICASFAGITFGYGANFVINGLDSVLLPYTNNAAHILDTSYNVNISGNLFFIIASSIVLAFLGTIITEKYVIPRLGKYTSTNEEENNIPLNSNEKKGLIISITTIVLISLLVIYCIIPGLPFSGLLLYLKDSTYIEQLFGYNSYFNQGSVFIFSVLLIIAGLIYGLRLKTIKHNKDFIDGMNYYLTNISSILVLMFFVAQFVAVFKKSNLGVFVTASIIEFIGSLQISGILLIIITFIVILICSIFLPVASTKWAIMSPVLIPMFMQSSFTPEFATAIFRAGDAVIKSINPLFTYFVILIGFLQIYNQDNKNVTITDAMSLIAPYTISAIVVWILIILGFYIIGIPLGPSVNPII